MSIAASSGTPTHQFVQAGLIAWLRESITPLIALGCMPILFRIGSLPMYHPHIARPVLSLIAFGLLVWMLDRMMLLTCTWQGHFLAIESLAGDPDWPTERTAPMVLTLKLRVFQKIHVAPPTIEHTDGITDAVAPADDEPRIKANLAGDTQ